MGDDLNKDFSNIIESFNLKPGEPIPCEGESITVSKVGNRLFVKSVLKDYRQVDKYNVDDPGRGGIVIYVFV